MKKKLKQIAKIILSKKRNDIQYFEENFSKEYLTEFDETLLNHHNKNGPIL